MIVIRTVKHEDCSLTLTIYRLSLKTSWVGTALFYAITTTTETVSTVILYGRGIGSRNVPEFIPRIGSIVKSSKVGMITRHQ
jgi:hypothetical protein